MKYAIPAAIAAAVLALPAAAQVGPSYDCAKAQTAVEHAICNDPDLSFLDREIAALYQAAQAGPDMNAVRQSEPDRPATRMDRQPQRLRVVPDLTACVTAIYGQRILELKSHYEGASGDGGVASFGPVTFVCEAPVHGMTAVYLNGPVTRWVVVSWDDSAVTLVNAVSDDGERYAPSVFGDPIEYWTSHDEAIFTIPGQPAVGCVQPQG
ncbi:MAG: MliC family protein [Paracoccaceae bacterium]